MMVHSCCAYGCREKYVQRGRGRYTFHGFPKDEKRRKLWEMKLRWKNFHATKSTKICSKHFTDDCFDREKFGGTWLKSNAVPTQFDFPSHLVPKTLPPRKPPKARVSPTAIGKTLNPIVVKIQRAAMVKTEESDVKKSQEPTVKKPQEFEVDETQKSTVKKTRESPTSKSESDVYKRPAIKRTHYVGDFTEEDMQSPTKALKLLHVAKQQTTKQQRELRTLLQKNHRLEKRIESLTLMLHELKKKSKNTDSAMDDLEVSPPEFKSELIKRTKLDSIQEKCPSELREFAVTLNFCSNKEYNYVRKTFNTSLPHLSTLRKWHQSANGSPGSTAKILSELNNAEVAEASAQN